MGSNFMAVYVCDLDQIIQLLQSRDGTAVQAITAAADQPLTASESEALRLLVERRYVRDPHTSVADNGDVLIRAFERVCRHLCSSHAGVDMYEDEDETPLLWEFVWDAEDPLDLPTSPHGTPAVGWHDPEQTAHYVTGFSRQRADGSIDEQFLQPEELDVLIDLLTAAQAQGRGVFVFRED